MRLGHADYLKNMITGAAQMDEFKGDIGCGWSNAANSRTTGEASRHANARRLLE